MLKKMEDDPQPEKLKRSRIGVYGAARTKDKVFLIIQDRGLYVGRYDLPGGGMEFGESPEQTLRREFQEETNFGFESMELLGNFTSTVEVPSMNGKAPYTLHRIGLIYTVSGLKPLERVETHPLLQFGWIDIGTLTQDNATPFVLDAINQT